MLEKILPWIGGIFAVVGLVLIFIDAINTIKRRDRTKTNVVGLILLSVAVAGYLITDIILPASMPEGSGWPPLASFVWIAMFWLYVLLDAITMMGDIKVVRKKRKAKKIAAKHSHPDPHGDDAVAEAERIWDEKHANEQVQKEHLEENK